MIPRYKALDMPSVVQIRAEYVTTLERCINDLVAILALPALWSGKDAQHIVQTVLDTLATMLDLDLVCLDVRDSSCISHPVLRTAPALDSLARGQILAVLDRWLRDTSHNLLPTGTIDVKGRELSVAALRIGVQGEIGTLLAASRRPDFPKQTESLILNVATNQAAIALQEARLFAEQQRVAHELDGNVAQRTRELAEANDILRREINERQKAEERLRESEAALWKAVTEITHSEGKLRQVLDTIPALAWCNLPDGPNEFLNKAWHQYTGLSPEESHGWGWQVVFHAEDLPHLMSKWGEMLVTGESGQMEARIRRNDGVYRWFLIRAEPFRDEAGNILRWYGTSTDIEDLKQTQRALQESEAKLNTIINATPAMVWTTRPDGFADFFNANYLSYLGLSRDELLGWGWTAAVHPEDLPRLAEIWSAVRATGKAGEAEARMRRFDGEYRWFLMRTEPMRDEAGVITKWFGLNTDIEDRKRIEEQLLRSEEFLREGQNLARLGNFSWLVESGVITWSEQLYHIFEFAAKEEITVERIATRVHPEDAHLLLETADQARRAVPDFEFEHRLLMPNGSVKYLRVIAHLVPNKAGHIEYLGAVQDVTQHYVAETALARARTELAKVSRVASLSVLTAAIAHEVNQPISGIVTNASTCLRMLASDPPNVEGARETARRAIRDGNRASEVIARLRTLFTRRENTIESLNLNDATREVIALSMNEFQRNQVIVRSELAANLPSIRGDRVQLQQVILNLLRNAADSMSRVHDRPREVVIRSEREDQSAIRLSVIDDGTGLEPEAADRLFQPFYTTKPEGMGIGLCISRSIIEAHQGRLWARPNEGPGATFCFTLPCEGNTNV